LPAKGVLPKRDVKNRLAIGHPGLPVGVRHRDFVKVSR
jgi:hypothetical protein